MIFNPNVMAAAGGGGGAVTGTYTGNGASYRRFTFDFEPAMMIIVRNAGTYDFKVAYRTTVISGADFATVEIMQSDTRNYGSLLLSVLNVETQSKAVRVSSIDSTAMPAINSSNVTYTYIVIPKA